MESRVCVSHATRGFVTCSCCCLGARISEGGQCGLTQVTRSFVTCSCCCLGARISEGGQCGRTHSARSFATYSRCCRSARVLRRRGRVGLPTLPAVLSCAPEGRCFPCVSEGGHFCPVCHLSSVSVPQTLQFSSSAKKSRFSRIFASFRADQLGLDP